MKLNKEYIKLFSCCIPIKGISRCAICDLQSWYVILIPNALYNLIPFFDTLNKNNVINFYGEENRKTVQEYIDFLIEHELAFYCNEEDVACFPPIDVSVFHIPYHVTNAIVELNGVNLTHINNIINELNSVLCPAIEIRVHSKITLLEIDRLISLFETPDVLVTEIHLIAIENSLDFEALKSLFKKYMRLTTLIISESDKNERHNDFFVGNSTIVYTTRKVTLPTCCGNFSTESFTINLPFFTESQSHNTCLHRKVAIDKDGNIKNCPSMSKTFGNIADTHLTDVIENPEFTKLWHIKKDQIKICQVCEFRHVCMDCRAYLEDPDDLYSKPLKCGYNPYTMEWEEWSTNPLKKLVMEQYGMKDHEL